MPVISVPLTSLALHGDSRMVGNIFVAVASPPSIINPNVGTGRFASVTFATPFPFMSDISWAVYAKAYPEELAVGLVPTLYVNPIGLNEQGQGVALFPGVLTFASANWQWMARTRSQYPTAVLGLQLMLGPPGVHLDIMAIAAGDPASIEALIQRPPVVTPPVVTPPVVTPPVVIPPILPRPASDQTSWGWLLLLGGIAVALFAPRLKPRRRSR